MHISILKAAKAAIVFTAVVLALSTAPRAQADGAATFKAKCASCHAADGSGDSPTGKAMKVGDLRSADAQKLTDAQLTDIITNGKAKMPAYKGKLTDAQIKELVGTIRDLAKKK